MEGIEAVRDIGLTMGWYGVWHLLTTYWPIYFAGFMLFSAIGFGFRFVLSFVRGGK